MSANTMSFLARKPLNVEGNTDLVKAAETAVPVSFISCGGYAMPSPYTGSAPAQARKLAI